MKKTVLVILAIAMCVILCACGSDRTDNPSESAPTDAVVTPTDAVTEPSSEQAQENRVYDATDAFKYSETEGGIKIIQFLNDEYTEYDKIIVPSEIDGRKVVGIGSREMSLPVFGAVFGNCEVVLPDTVEFIGKQAFDSSFGLVKVSGGKNVSVIDEGAFRYCSNLEEIEFLDTVETIADDAFFACPKLATP